MAPRMLTLFAAAAAAASATPLLAAAPEGTPATRYCMRIDALTGSRVELVRCWTRAQWEAQGVDVDRDWAENGVRMIG